MSAYLLDGHLSWSEMSRKSGRHAVTLEPVSLNFISPRKSIPTLGRCSSRAFIILSDHLEWTAI